MEVDAHGGLADWERLSGPNNVVICEDVVVKDQAVISDEECQPQVSGSHRHKDALSTGGSRDRGLRKEGAVAEDGGGTGRDMGDRRDVAVSPTLMGRTMSHRDPEQFDRAVVEGQNAVGFGLAPPEFDH